jgi:chromosome partitioning protein
MHGGVRGVADNTDNRSAGGSTGLDATMVEVFTVLPPRAPGEPLPIHVGVGVHEVMNSVPASSPSPTPAAAPVPAPEATPDPVAHDTHTRPAPPPPAAEPAPSASRRPRLIAMINQKGGVGKTTTTVNVGAALAREGHRVLMVDLDPQGHLTLHLGIDAANASGTIYELLTDTAVTATDVVCQAAENLWVLGADVNLAGVESELAGQAITGKAQRLLRDKVMPLVEAGPTGDGAQPFDYVIIDCPPSLGLLTISSLVLAQEVIVPMQAHFLALQGLAKLLETVKLIRQSFNPALVVSGIVLCMHESQTLLASEVMENLRGFLEQSQSQDVPWRGARVLEPAIRRNIKLAECPSFGKTIFDYEPTCAGAQDYRRLAQQIASLRPVRADE